MKVKKLINLLNELDPNDIVIIAKDREGNGYSPLDEISSDVYDKDYGDIHIRELTPELKAEGWSEEDLCQGKCQNCVTLWPVN